MEIVSGVLGAIVVINFIGLSVLVSWLVRTIRALQGNVAALEGTVRAQEQHIKSIAEINRSVVEVFKAMDPERWAKEVRYHKELADRRVETIIEEARRKLESDRQSMTEDANRRAKESGEAFLACLTFLLELIPYVLKTHRDLMIAKAKLGDDFKGVLRDYAARVPELKFGLSDFAQLYTEQLGDLAHVELTPPPARSPRQTG